MRKVQIRAQVVLEKKTGLCYLPLLGPAPDRGPLAAVLQLSASYSLSFCFSIFFFPSSLCFSVAEVMCLCPLCLGGNTGHMGVCLPPRWPCLGVGSAAARSGPKASAVPLRVLLLQSCLAQSQVDLGVSDLI